MMTVSQAVAPLAVTLFGPMQVSVAGQPLPRLRSRKSLWLLALLALRQGQPVEREWLAETLWPDADADQSLTSLRTVLCELRQAMGREGGRLQSPNRHSLCLDLGGMSIDLLEFDAAKSSREAAALKQAVALYRGPLLEGCTEEWVAQERLVREQDCLRALQTLADAALAAEDFETAAGYYRRAAGIDPWREAAQRGLMQALSGGGDSNAALNVYLAFTRLLRKDDPRASPDEKTTTLYTSLRAAARRRASQPPRTVSEAIPTPVVTGYVPHSLTDLIGREEEREVVAGRLRRFRLVTLTGPGGIGKTRLSLAVAAEAASEYADGVWLVSLDSLSEGTQVGRQIVAALGLKEEPERSALQTLTASLRQKCLLLVLDNCEHLLEASAQIAAHLLQGCAGVQILTTSREPLGITGEAAWAVPGLTVPDPAFLPVNLASVPHLLMEYESVRLFVERAQAANPNFELTERSAPAVAQICARLEGIPLAIELAAARVRVLTAQQIAARLDDYLSLLTGGSRTAAPRHKTLCSTLDWSYDLLCPPERLLLARLSVFAGGWTLDAAEQVCAGDEIAAPQVLDLLTGIVDKSLAAAVAVPVGGETRYRFLEPIRQYAEKRLAEQGNAEKVRDRHLSWCVALAEGAQPWMKRHEERTWVMRLETEHDNLRVALAWGEESPAGAEQTLRLAGALEYFWYIRGYWAEEQKHLTAALAREGVAGNTVARAKALEGLARLAQYQGDWEVLRSLSEALLTVSREIGDHAGEAESLIYLGYVKHAQGDREVACSYFKQSLVICREYGNLLGEGRNYNGLGNVKYVQQDWAAASSYFEQSLAIRCEIGDRHGKAWSLRNLGWVKSSQRDFEAARSLYEQALTTYCENENPANELMSLRCLGDLAYFQGDWESANSYFERSLAISRKIGNRIEEAGNLHSLGWVKCSQGDFEAARSYAEGALTISREAENFQVEALSLISLGRIAGEQNRLAEARALLVQSLTLHDKVDDAEITISTLAEWAALALADGDALHAACFAGTAQAGRDANSIPVPPYRKDRDECMLSAARTALGEDAFAEAWEAGRAMTLAEAVHHALGNGSDTVTGKASRATVPGESQGAAGSFPHRSRQ